MEEAVKVRTGVPEARSGKLIHRFIVGLPPVLLPFLLGGSPPWFWSFCAAFILIGSVAFIWSDRYPGLISGVSNKVVLLLGPFFLYPFLQVLPLPDSWLAFLSPHRLMWIKRAEEATQLHTALTSLSYLPLATLIGWFFWIALAVYALMLHTMLRREKDLGWLFGILFCFVGLEAFYGLLQVFIPSLGLPFAHGNSFLAQSGYARGTFVNRNHFAAFLGMTWPILLMYVISLARKTDRIGSLSFTEKERFGQVRQKQIFMTLILGIVLLALVFSLSRGGIIGALISLTILVAVGGIRKGSMSAFVAVCWMIMLAYGSLIGFDQILERFDLMEKDAPSRFKIWEDTANMIKDHPLTGTGLGSYRTAIRLYQSHLSDQYDIGEAHNDYLQLTAELGFPAAGGTILLVWGYWWKNALRLRRRALSIRIAETEARRAARGKSREGYPPDAENAAHLPESRSGEQRQLIALGALAGSAAFLCHSWVEFNWQIPANQLYFVMLLVMLRFGSLRSERRGEGETGGRGEERTC
ncbi:MAG: O-antigen ligase family protein [Syntrophobacteraceae bacterium]